jgi:hypothetical protein
MKPAFLELDDFTRGYIVAALWSTNDESDERGGEPLDKNYCYDNIDDDTATSMIEDCRKFQEQYAHLFPVGNAGSDGDGPYTWAEKAGHDFWLTRCNHGVGYWDGSWPEPAATTLTEACAKWKEVDLYVGSDGVIYAM